MAGDRTEQATPQRRDKARQEGDVLVSRELTAAAGTLAGVMALGVAGPRFAMAWRETLTGFLALGAPAAWEQDQQAGTLIAIRNLSGHVLAPLAMVAVAVVTAALAAAAAQSGGVQVHPKRIGVKLERINPWTNLGNLFSMRAVARLGKSLFPAAFLIAFAVQVMARQLRLPAFSLARLTGIAQDAYRLLSMASWLLFAWALVDYLVEWRSREKRLRMSRQEMREEYKEQEGNPQVRGRIRNLQRAARRRRMKADVARAAVVVTNPTHYAVALAFDFDVMDAPKVLAKGKNLFAQEIREQARWAGVPILENPPLARSLYRTVEPGEPIPTDLYAAVASILAFLYRQRVEEQMRARRAWQPAAAASASTPPEPTAVLRSTMRPSTTSSSKDPAPKGDIQ